MDNTKQSCGELFFEKLEAILNATHTENYGGDLAKEEIIHGILDVAYDNNLSPKEFRSSLNQAIYLLKKKWTGESNHNAIDIVYNRVCVNILNDYDDRFSGVLPKSR